MTKTDHHSYETPEKGSTDWHVPLNANFEKLDRDIEIRDEEATIGDYIPKAGAKFLAVDTGSIFIGDGAEWNELNLSYGSTVQSSNINNELYASEFDGDGLASKVENALGWLADNTDGEGRIRITPRNDGVRWKWDRDVTIDSSVHEGVHLDIDKNVSIEYPGDGVALTIEGGSGEHEPTIEGGVWSFSGDPDGWLKIQDTYGTIVSPARVEDCFNSGGDAFGVSIENHDSWSEYTRVRDAFIRADRPVQFRTAAETGGNGTDSFQETKIRNCHLRGTDYCIRTKGNIKYSVIESTTFRPEADGARCLWFDHRYMNGSIAQNLKFEDVANHSRDVAIYDPENSTWYGPMIIEPAFLHMSTEFKGGSSLHKLRYAGESFCFEWPTQGKKVELSKDGLSTD